MRLRALLVGAGLLGSLVLGSVLARADTRPELGDLVAGSLPTAAPVAAVVPADLPTDLTAATVPGPDPRWVRRTAAATGIPRPAVRAYGRAEIVVGREQARCHLGWTTLAGIGWVESQQGTVGGRTLGADGVPSEPVAGPVLDGTTYAAVPGADGRWATALGPMQFLPGTWATWAADGDGDGRADVEDLDDASLAAARYLCADDHDLATGTGWGAAVLSYNHDPAYVTAVYDAARTYDDRATSGRR